MKKKLTIVMPICWRDKERVKDTIPLLIKRFDPGKIVLAGPETMRTELELPYECVEYIDGNLVVPGMTKESIGELIVSIQRTAGVAENPVRAGWLLQQFIKLGYALNFEDEEYLVWDADVLLIDDFELKKNGKPKFFLYDKHMHVEYLPTIKKLLGDNLKPHGEYTFVNHYMIFETRLVREMLDKILINDDVAGDTWWEKCIYAIRLQDLSRSGFSEFETYGEYVIANHPDAYVEERGYEHLLCTKRYFGENVEKEMIPWIAKNYKTIGFEGYDSPNEYWINKTLKAYKKGKVLSTVVRLDGRRETIKNYYRSFVKKTGIDKYCRKNKS